MTFHGWTAPVGIMCKFKNSRCLGLAGPCLHLSMKAGHLLFLRCECVSVVLKLNIYLDFKSTVASAGMAWECIATLHLYIKREIKSLHSTDSLVEYTCVKRQRSLAASASLQPLADRQSRMAWLLDLSPFVCGTDAEQTLHSRCVDVEASGRRYTVIKNSVIACGLFPLLSLFLLSLFSPSARSIPPLLPFFSVIELLCSAYLVYMYFPAWGIEAAFTLKICKLYFTRAVSEALYSSTIHFVHCLSNGHLLSSVFLLLVNFLDSPQEEKKEITALLRIVSWLEHHPSTHPQFVDKCFSKLLFCRALNKMATVLKVFK